MISQHEEKDTETRKPSSSSSLIRFSFISYFYLFLDKTLLFQTYRAVHNDFKNNKIIHMQNYILSLLYQTNILYAIFHLSDSESISSVEAFISILMQTCAFPIFSHSYCWNALRNYAESMKSLFIFLTLAR